MTLAAGDKKLTRMVARDWLGTKRVRTNVSGAVAETCESLSYGDDYSCSTSDISPLHFTGKTRDGTGLSHFPARYYSPFAGRFMSPDPLGGSVLNPQSLNRYSYVLDNPERFIDPLGLQCQQPKDGVMHCTSYGYSMDIAGFRRFLAESSMESCYPLWCTKAPPPDAVVYKIMSAFGKRLQSVPSGAKSPQAQVPKRPRKEPCTPLANSLQGTPAAGLDTLLDGFHRLLSPLEMISENGFIFLGGRDRSPLVAR